MIRNLCAITVAATLFVGQASASVIAHVYEQANGSGGTDVVATYEGSLELSGGNVSFSYGSSAMLQSYSGRQFTVSSGVQSFSRPYQDSMQTAGTTTKDGNALTNADFYSSSGFSKTLSSGVLDAGSTGFFFWMTPSYTGYSIEEGYVSGTLFSGRMTFANSNLRDLGLTSSMLGHYEANFATATGTQSISLTLGGVVSRKWWKFFGSVLRAG